MVVVVCFAFGVRGNCRPPNENGIGPRANAIEPLPGTSAHQRRARPKPESAFTQSEQKEILLFARGWKLLGGTLRNHPC